MKRPSELMGSFTMASARKNVSGVFQATASSKTQQNDCNNSVYPYCHLRTTNVKNFAIQK
jgi:hypothetical protein